MTTPIFPDVFPDYMKTLTLSDFGVVITPMPDGFETRSAPNYSGAGAMITLEFKNRSALELKLITDFYKNMRGGFRAFTLPNSIIRHPNSYKLQLFNLIEGYSWKFNKKLIIKTEFRDCYSFEVELKSIAANFTLPSATSDNFPCPVVI